MTTRSAIFLALGIVAALITSNRAAAEKIAFVVDAQVTEFVGDTNLIPPSADLGSVVRAEYVVNLQDLSGSAFVRRYGVGTIRLGDTFFTSRPVNYSRRDELGIDGVPNSSSTLRIEGRIVGYSDSDSDALFVGYQSLRMSGDDGAYSRHDQLLSTDTWENLNLFRVLDIGLRPPGSGSEDDPTLTIRATVSRVTVVPEPNAAILLWLLVAEPALHLRPSTRT